MSPEANNLLAKLYKTGKHPAKNRKAAAELMDAGLAEPGKGGGLKILPAGRFAAWQAQKSAGKMGRLHDPSAYPACVQTNDR